MPRAAPHAARRSSSGRSKRVARIVFRPPRPARTRRGRAKTRGGPTPPWPTAKSQRRSRRGSRPGSTRFWGGAAPRATSGRVQPRLDPALRLCSKHDVQGRTAGGGDAALVEGRGRALRRRRAGPIDRGVPGLVGLLRLGQVRGPPAEGVADPWGGPTTSRISSWRTATPRFWRGSSGRSTTRATCTCTTST